MGYTSPRARTATNPPNPTKNPLNDIGARCEFKQKGQASPVRRLGATTDNARAFQKNSARSSSRACPRGIRSQFLCKIQEIARAIAAATAFAQKNIYQHLTTKISRWRLGKSRKNC